MKRSVIAVRRNVWGNLNGYVGGRKLREFGLDEVAAREWIRLQHETEIDSLRVSHQLEMHESEQHMVTDCMPAGPCR